MREARAHELIRAHRLWEHYLVKREGMSLDAVHAEAHRREHETSLEEVERLRDKGVLVADVSNQLPAGFFRVSIGTPGETDAFVDALAEQRWPRLE